MRYQVTMNNKPLSTHKSRKLAERALRKWMKTHREQREADRRDYEWLGLFDDVQKINIYQIITID